MRPLVMLLVLASTVAALRAEEMTPIAVGGWSDWDDGLRGRLLLFKGRSMLTPEHRETLVFVELERRLGDSGGTTDVYFDPRELSCELHDDEGDAVALHAMTDRQQKFYERRRPTPCWVTLPDAAALRLRVSPYCAGSDEEGSLLIPLYDTAWMIQPLGKGDYVLTGVLSVVPPKHQDRANAWRGKLVLPKAKFSVAKQ